MSKEIPQLYVGLVGLALPIDEYDLGHGVRLRKVYTHVMAPYMAAFSEAEPGKPHPAPWKAVSGGYAEDIRAELFVPEWFSEGDLDQQSAIWWLLHLLRTQAVSTVTSPVFASHPFDEIKDLDGEPQFWPIELTPFRLRIRKHEPGVATPEALDWINENWLAGGTLYQTSREFKLLVDAASYCMWAGTYDLALVMLWGALEQMFCPFHQELSFRVSATLASYLEPPGERRLALFKRVKRLYGSRSKAAHGVLQRDREAVEETFDLTRAVIRRIVDSRHVPQRDELEELLLNGPVQAVGANGT